MLRCDLNCDMGEGVGNDELLLPYITSANIACGYHAGSYSSMQALVEQCLKYQVLIGAHPSYPDRKNFGREDLLDKELRPEDLTGIIQDQLQQLGNICASAGTKINHVKPHGALYNRASLDAEVASLICNSLIAYDSSLILYGLSNSELTRQAEMLGIHFKSEVFADRTYQEDGSLTPRKEKGALIINRENCLHQVREMVHLNYVTTKSGKIIPVVVDTICIHGDGEHAAEFAELINKELSK